MISYTFTLSSGQTIDERQLAAEFANASFGAKFEDVYQNSDTTVEAWFNVDLTVDEQTEAQNIVANHVPTMVHVWDSLKQVVNYNGNGLVASVDYYDQNGTLIKREVYGYDSNSALSSVTTEWYYGLSFVVETETATITRDPNTGLITEVVE